MKDTQQYYGTISRLLHWSMAAAFAVMLFTAAMWNFNEDYFSLMGLHKSVGFFVDDFDCGARDLGCAKRKKIAHTAI